MNWIETFNLVISLLAVSVSAYSIYLTDQNKQKQQELEKEMQKNEFNFSVKKVWYEKQNSIIDSSIEKLVENLNFLNRLHISYDESTEKSRAIEDLLDDLRKADEEKVNKELATWSDDEADEKIQNLINDRVEINRKKTIEEELEQMLSIYNNLLYLKSHRHYFPKKLDEKITRINNLTRQSLRIKRKETNTKEARKISQTLLTEINLITNFIRKEFMM